jgi:two-component system NarL family response regulator
VKIVILTSSEDEESLFNAVKYGASGYLLKSTNASELVEMLGDLENGGIPVSQGLAAKLFEEFQQRDSDKFAPPAATGEQTHQAQLTTRQLEILEMVARGVSYREVGEALGLTERTIGAACEPRLNARGSECEETVKATPFVVGRMAAAA